MRCAERRAAGLALLLWLLQVAGCSQRPLPVAPAPVATPVPPAGATNAPPAVPPTAPPAGPATAPSTRPQPAVPPALPPWRHATSWDDYRRQAALRIVAANPEGSYAGPVPQPALAIPVLEIELQADGSLRRIQVLRRPGQAADTVQLATAAVQRAAPFGPVGHLPRPWRFTETFLFDDQRRFKPRTLDP